MIYTVYAKEHDMTFIMEERVEIENQEGKEEGAFAFSVAAEAGGAATAAEAGGAATDAEAGGAGDSRASTISVIGFYFGEPSDDATAKFMGKLVAILTK